MITYYIDINQWQQWRACCELLPALVHMWVDVRPHSTQTALPHGGDLECGQHCPPGRWHCLSFSLCIYSEIQFAFTIAIISWWSYPIIISHHRSSSQAMCHPSSSALPSSTSSYTWPIIQSWSAFARRKRPSSQLFVDTQLYTILHYLSLTFTWSDLPGIVAGIVGPGTGLLCASADGLVALSCRLEWQHKPEQITLVTASTEGIEVEWNNIRLSL